MFCKYCIELKHEWDEGIINNLPLLMFAIHKIRQKALQFSSADLVYFLDMLFVVWFSLASQILQLV